MIVLYKEEGWEVITQRAHGILAAQIGFQWRMKDRPERWMETLLAIAEHDDAENELDGETLITETGGPLNFSMKSFELQHCQKLSTLTRTKSRYIALLISMHMEFLYSQFEGKDLAAKNFLKEQRALQTQWRKELNLSKEETHRIYNLLEWCDALSLLICKGEMQPERRKSEISSGPDKKVYHLIQIDEQTLTVDPWPFQEKSFSIYFEFRLIPQIQFESSLAFRQAFIDAEVKEITWKIVKQKIAPTVRKVKS